MVARTQRLQAYVPSESWKALKVGKELRKLLNVAEQVEIRNLGRCFHYIPPERKEEGERDGVNIDREHMPSEGLVRFEQELEEGKSI